MPALGMRIAAFVMAVLAVVGAAGPVWADAPPQSRSRVEAALANIKSLVRPGQDGLATIWDGNKYVQCRLIADGALRCEAAGTLMQPSLGRILGPDRIARLTALGWNIDLAFGNYVRVFPSDVPIDRVADQLLQALAEGYQADLAELETRTDWVRSEPCPPRNGPSQNLAGIINDAPAMRRTAIHACRYDPGPDSHPAAPIDTAAGLIETYGNTVTGEIQRLRINIDRRVFFVLETGAGYVQCGAATQPAAFYCEAQSADSWEVLARILTPDRVARLHAAGYADPGRAPNYSKTYQADQFTDAAIAAELLTILHDVYSYDGLPKLKIKTEKGWY